MARINNKLGIIICILLVAMMFLGCTNKQNTVPLPPPENKCPADLNWRGLIPGQSTREDVVKELGTPSGKGKLRFENQYIAYYAYKVHGGEISKYASDRIFFRPDGLIDWMEIVKADRDGSLEAVLDTVLHLGNKVDTFYSNNSYKPSPTPIYGDVWAGPDQIYVWSECGLVLDALPSRYSQSFQADRTECKPTNESNGTSDICNLVSRHPNPTYSGGEPGADVNSVVLMKFYFQPTSYEAFTKFYMYKIPYGLWDEYLAKNK